MLHFKQLPEGIYNGTMAGQALPESTKSDEIEVRVDRDAVRETAAKMYGAGLKRSAIARALVDYLVPNGKERPLEQRLSQARNRLRNWERTESFRDMVYNLAVVKLDMGTPDVFKGLLKSGKKGRVDAARLILELTGRHNPKGDPTPPQIVVAINGMPRPGPVVASLRPAPDSVVDMLDPQKVPEDDEV